MWDDPIVNNIREIRRELEAEFGFDAQSIFKDIKQRQMSLGPRLVNRKKALADRPVKQTSQLTETHVKRCVIKSKAIPL